MSTLIAIPKERSFTRVRYETQLKQICLGALSVDIPDRLAQQHAEFIADHVITLIEREAEWVNRGVQPWKLERERKSK